MTLDALVKTIGIKGILVTNKPYFVEFRGKEQRYASHKEIIADFWKNPMDMARFDIRNYNVLDKDWEELSRVHSCIKQFDEVYERRDKHKYSYGQLLRRYAQKYFDIRNEM